jgi:adenylate cyclase class 2
MGSERELKFRVDDQSGLRSRLVELQVERNTSGHFEDNWVFDRGTELRDQQCLLRLREDGHGAWLAFKGPPTFEGAVRVRTEFESVVEDAAAIRGLLEQLGYRVASRYQKKREEWRIGGILVAIDNTPIGVYVEFEGDGAEKLAARCGFRQENAEPRSYLELYAEYRKDHPEEPEEMVFP